MSSNHYWFLVNWIIYDFIPIFGTIFITTHSHTCTHKHTHICSNHILTLINKFQQNGLWYALLTVFVTNIREKSTHLVHFLGNYPDTSSSTGVNRVETKEGTQGNLFSFLRIFINCHIFLILISIFFYRNMGFSEKSIMLVNCISLNL